MPVSNDELKGLYYYMNLVRQVDERCRRLFKQGRFHGTYFSAVGQEATVVGACYGLRPEDFIGIQHREIGAEPIRRGPVDLGNRRRQAMVDEVEDRVVKVFPGALVRTESSVAPILVDYTFAPGLDKVALLFADASSYSVEIVPIDLNGLARSAATGEQYRVEGAGKPRYVFSSVVGPPLAQCRRW